MRIYQHVVSQHRTGDQMKRPLRVSENGYADQITSERLKKNWKR